MNWFTSASSLLAKTKVNSWKQFIDYIQILVTIKNSKTNTGFIQKLWGKGSLSVWASYTSFSLTWQGRGCIMNFVIKLKILFPLVLYFHDMRLFFKKAFFHVCFLKINQDCFSGSTFPSMSKFPKVFNFSHFHLNFNKFRVRTSHKCCITGHWSTDLLIYSLARIAIIMNLSAFFFIYAIHHLKNLTLNEFHNLNSKLIKIHSNAVATLSLLLKSS